MARMRKDGYLERRTSKGGSAPKRSFNSIWRDWWLVKHCKYNANIGTLHNIKLPNEYIGKKVRIRIEILKETRNEESN